MQLIGECGQHVAHEQGALITFKERLDFVATYNYNYDQGIKINRGVETQEKQ
jgi:hypothetical protein